MQAARTLGGGWPWGSQVIEDSGEKDDIFFGKRVTVYPGAVAIFYVSFAG
jgi:hypothetical protein